MIHFPAILVLDTCGSEGKVALARVQAGRATVLGEATIAGKTFTAELVPTISGLLQGANIRLADLDALAVVHGPGSFTGVRIGVSTAKGLVEAAAIPLIAISRLAVLDRLSGLQGRTIAVFDAGRGEFYGGIYENGQPIREALMCYEEVMAEATMPSPTTGQSPMIGQFPNLLVCEERVQAAFAALAPRMLSLPTVTDALPLAVERWQSAEFDDPLTLDGNYLRRSEAEIFSRQARDLDTKRKGTETASHDSAT